MLKIIAEIFKTWYESQNKHALQRFEGIQKNLIKNLELNFKR